jgi:hypothetical protein
MTRPAPRGRGAGTRCAALALATSVVLALAAFPVRAQDEHKHKVPGLDKLTSGGATQQAFTGKVQSLDMKGEILNIHSVQDDSVEIFPIKKTTHVSTAQGERMDVQNLQPGTNVLVYYEQKGDRRTVKQVVVLGAGPEPQKKEEKSTPPS